MSFMKKKRFKFQVQFEVEALSSVPLVSGVLFVKIRLLDGGSFTEYSTREEIFDHLVVWKSQYTFQTKMVASANTGVLEPCVCRVSIRKEVKGGKSFQKLGFADINLAEFAGAGNIQRRYLLEGYDSKKRQDNSILKVNVNMTLLSGDPCFKAPRSRQTQAVLPETEQDLQPENKGGGGEENDPAGGDPSGDSVASGSSGFGSLPRRDPGGPSARVSTDPHGDTGGSDLGVPGLPPGGGRLGVGLSACSCSDHDLPGHTRNASCTSNHSKVSGYSSATAATATHSRQSSYEGALHRRTSSQDSSDQSRYGSTGRPKKLEPSSSIERRVDSTRVDVDTILDEIMQATDLHGVDESAEASGLQLYIAKDGTTALGTQQIRSKGVTSKFEPVIIDDR